MQPTGAGPGDCRSRVPGRRAVRQSSMVRLAGCASRTLTDVSDSDAVTAAKRAAGEAAVDNCVRSGMAVGLGTGSTAIWAIRRIGELLADGALSDLVGLPTSDASAAEATRCGIPLTTFEEHPSWTSRSTARTRSTLRST